MALPFLALLGVGMQGLGKGVQLYNQYQQATEQGEALDRQSRALRRQAGETRVLGAYDAMQVQAEGSAFAESQAAAYRAGNVETTSGTPAAVIASTRALSAYDEDMIRANAARQARGYERAANEAGRQAGEVREARNWGVVGGAIALAGQVGGQLYGASTEGLFGGEGLPESGAAGPAMAQQAGSVHAAYGGRRPPSTARGRRLYSDLWE